METSAVGTEEVSRALQRWVVDGKIRSPVGTTEEARGLSRVAGECRRYATHYALMRFPSAQALG